MIRKILSLVMIVLVVTLSLAACKKDNDNGGSTNNDGADGDTDSGVNSGIIYSPDVAASIIKSAAADTLNLRPVFERLYELTGELMTISSDSSVKTGSEIVFGETNRAVSTAAKDALDKKIALAIRDSEDAQEFVTDYVGYAVYSDGDSVAIVWSDDYTLEMAINDFIEKFLVADTLKLEKGYVHTNVFSLLAHKKSLEEAEREEMFAEIELELGKEVTDALRNYYSIFDDRYYKWMANLYDPGEYDEDGNPLGGGYYFSNSGRDTAGYGIDLESTYQALQLLSSTGMLVNYGDDFGAALREALPEKMQKEIVAFVLSLQSSEDGYFYHPQWEGVSVSRRGRDLDWATKLLELFGAKPYWNTPNGVKGTYGAPGQTPVSALTGTLSGSSVQAVSAIIPVNTDNLPTELKTLENFKAYLESYTSSMATNSYSIGNTFGAISSQIIARGKDYIKAFEDWANALQNPENGLWEAGVYYNSINGLMKISGTYNTLGLEFHYAEQALNSALQMILHEGEDSKGKAAINSVDVWNPFCAVTNLITNIETHGTEATVDAFMQKTREHALEIVKVTTEKNVQFKELDGSFSYNVGPGAGTSQGSPVAVAGTDEGDINGGNIAVTGVSNYMCRILGIDVIPIYYPTDLEIYVGIIEDLSPVIKDDYVMESEPINFDEDVVGSTHPNKISVQAGTGSVTVVEDPREGADGNVIEFITKKGVYTAIGINPTASRYNSCYVLDFDVCFADVVEGRVLFQVKMGKSYMFTMGVQNGRVVLGDSSNTNGQIAVAQNFGDFFNQGEWGNIRVEFYPSNDEAEIRVKMYVNGNLVVISDNYVGHPQSGVGEPVRGYDSVEFYALQNSDLTAYFDNLEIKKVDKKFDLKDGTALVKWFVTNSEYENVFGYLGTGKFADTEKTDKYEGGAYNGLVGSSATASVINEGTNKILRIEKIGAEYAVAEFLRYNMRGTVYVAETDIKWIAPEKSSDATYFKILLASSSYVNGGDPFAELYAVDDGEGNVLLKAADGETVATLYDNRWQNVRIEAVPLYSDAKSFDFSLFIDGKSVYSVRMTADSKESIANYAGFAIELCAGASGYKLDLDNTYKGVAVTTAHPDIEYAYASPERFDSSISSDYVVQKAVSGYTVSDYVSLSTDPADAVGGVLKAFTPRDAAKEYVAFTQIKNSSGNNGSDAVYSSLSAKVYFETNGDTTAGRVARLIFKDSSYAFGIDLFVIYNSSAKTYSLKATEYNLGTGGTGSDTLFEGVMVIDQWFDLRIDYCKCGTSSVLSIYINGECYVNDVVSYYYAEKIVNAGAVKELEWRYIRNGVTTYLDDVVYECRVADVDLYEGDDDVVEEPDEPTLPDTPEDPDVPTVPEIPTDPDNPGDDIGGIENPDKDGANKEDSMPDGGWVEEEK